MEVETGAHIQHSPSRASAGWTVKLAAALALGLLILLLIGEVFFIQTRDRGQRHITVEDGLVNFDLQSIAEGANGNLWIGHRTSFSQYWGTVNDDFIRQNYLDTAHIDQVAVTAAGEVWAYSASMYYSYMYVNDGVAAYACHHCQVGRETAGRNFLGSILGP